MVSTRVLDEIYLPPFEAAVDPGHVASLMCAYPEVNGTYQCQDPTLSQVLAQWGFTGFVRSDLGSVHDPVAASTAGTDLIKPSSVASLTTLVREGRLPVALVDAAVTRVLTQMFAHGLVGRQSSGAPGTPVDTTPHRPSPSSAPSSRRCCSRTPGSPSPGRPAHPFDRGDRGRRDPPPR